LTCRRSSIIVWCVWSDPMFYIWST
jgi:hypothetical protein